jgi:hypothetical protein
MQDNATTHAASRSMPVLREVFGDQVIGWRWPVSPDSNRAIFSVGYAER